MQSMKEPMMGAGPNPEQKKLGVDASYEQLEAAIPEVEAMKDFEQLNDFHSLTLDQHTKRLGSNLEEDEFVKGLPKKQRELLLLAGKLHDLGKVSPEGHQVHPKDPEKRQYLGHENESDRIIREVLPKHFELSSEDIDFVAKMAGLHASALTLMTNFAQNNEPKGKKLKSYDKFVARAEEIPGDMELIDKMRMIFALNKADKGAGYNESSDMADPKVENIKKLSDEGIAALNELEKALPALLAAIQGRRGGDNTAGIAFKDGEYVYEKPEVEKKVEVPLELRKLGGVLRDKTKVVAGLYEGLRGGSVDDAADKLKKVGLSDDQVAAVLETLE
ncbi:HD domain-containing protein [Candidatus Falkowbacteria bacterium]|jgi:hypothetical protein|nr:HD domain-containing protein [Candidatus Falkowbacteria bacterium]MBT7501033.1 HD domain-containing protein [Candidatus Falkowbacteria bacterium]